MSGAWVIVPCYNEERRLDPEAVFRLASREGLDVLLVDDGSRDGTKPLIERLASQRPRVHALVLPENGGKAEAVRQGMRFALGQGAKVVGYLDADMATPPEGAFDLLACISSRDEVKVVMGSRVRLLGRHVERTAARHYLGRVFATLASMALGLSVYDTQCGAKFFRAGRALDFALAEPFSSRWAFDVELIARLLSAPEDALAPDELVEVPLEVWQDKAGSKLTALAMIGAGLDLASIWMAMGERRGGAPPKGGRTTS